MPDAAPSTPGGGSAQVTLRWATPSDLPAIAHTMTRAFYDDDLFGDICHPHRAAHPQDPYLYWLRRAYVNFWHWNWRWVVAVAPNPNSTTTTNVSPHPSTGSTNVVRGGSEIVVGVAQWERMGTGGDAMQPAFYDPRAYMASASALAMKVHAWLWPNRACDPVDEDILERAYTVFGSVWSGDRAESWYLEWCTVDPEWQGKGVGRQLVQQGLGWAKEDKVWASVATTRGKEGFYQKCGFEHEYWSASAGEGNPLGKKWGAGRMFWTDFREEGGKKDGGDGSGK